MLRRITLPLTALLAAVALAGCSTTPGAGSAESAAPSASATPTPLASVATVEGCPADAGLDKAPARVATMDAGAAAFLIELGFGDAIVGTAGPDFKEDFTGSLRSKLDAIPVLDPARGSAEAIIGAKPDLVTGISQLQFGGFKGTATVDQLKAAGAAALSACGAVQQGPNENIDSAYRYVAALSNAFQEPARGDKLIEKLRGEVATATEAAKGAKNVPVLTLSGVPDAGAGINTSGGTSFANGVISLAGGRNIASDTLKNFATLSAEQVAAADPKVIVVVSGLSPDSPEALKAAIVASPLVAGTSAVKNGNVVVVPQRMLLSPSLLNAEAVKTIADAVAKVG